MKRPGLHIYLFGNPFSVLLIGLTAILLAFSWWNGGVTWPVALVAVLAAMGASKASERLDAYNEWKREWQAMSGEPVTAGRTFVSFRLPRIALGIAAWCVCAYLVATAGKTPDMQIAAALFWLATALLVGAGVYRRIKRFRRRPKPVRDAPVTICLPMPRASATAAQAFAALPGYCVALLGR